MPFGVKVKNFNTQKEYALTELYEIMSKHTFSAGVPSLSKIGISTIITFPALDFQNQVWVTIPSFTGGNRSSKKFSVQKSELAGNSSIATNMALSTVTKGWFGFGGMLGPNVKKCEKLVETTAAELEALNL